jgi:Flp pilus assembly protein TadD
MANRPTQTDAARLERNVAWALRNSFDARDVLPMVETLLRISERGSSTWVFAHRQLAELVVERQPWRAAAAARTAAAHDVDDCGARALLGLALTLLGHYRFAAKAYRDALALSPDNPWYAHNLGHLLDVALGRPKDAVVWLRRAFQREPHVEIAASLAHSLGRIGQAVEGERVLRRALGTAPQTTDQQALLAWLADGAPASRSSSRVRKPRTQKDLR